MAAYPNVALDNSTELTPRDGISVDIADDGTVRGRVNYATTLYRARVNHVLISSTDRDSILSHYAADKGNSFAFTYDGDAYTMRYAAHPRQKHLQGNWWSVTVVLIGTKDP